MEVLPSVLDCEAPAAAAREIAGDRPTRALLRRLGLSASDYVEIGWALIVAENPADFGLERSPSVAANARFLRKHRAEIAALMHGP